ncbi:Putative 28S rRNA (cytosine-C(5))-methyltransferase [Chamberlinius hualienensis]
MSRFIYLDRLICFFFFFVAVVLPPRYVRVNTLKSNVDDVIKQLRSEGYCLIEWESPDYNKFIKRVKSLTEDEFIRDYQFDDLLVFHPKSSFIYHHLYEEGVLVLQDKSSLLPVYALNPRPGSVILDCCAAPGLKSTHLAAYLNNDCTILSSDRSEERIQTMYTMVELHGAQCIQTSVIDFTEINPKEEPYSSVKYIILDPSCSGSGMVKKRIGEFNEIDPDRLKKLSDFQAILLKHALSFPSVKKVSYSTCSLYREENENVVLEALNLFGNRFKLAKLHKKEKLLPYLNDDIREGSSLYNRCLKTQPERDLSNGFFVAVFVRRKRKNSQETKLNDEMAVESTHDVEEPTFKSSKRKESATIDATELNEVTEDEHKVKRKKAKKSKS